MKTSTQGLTLLMEREGLENEAYPDPKSPLFKACQRQGINPLRGGYRQLASWETLSGEPWTVGIGHTGPEVSAGVVWTDEKCRDVLARDLERFERAVNACVTVPLEQYQFDALVSFAFNCGENALAHGNGGGPSSILRALNAGDYDGAGEAFNNWMADPEVRTRRAGEREQFKGEQFAARIA